MPESTAPAKAATAASLVLAPRLGVPQAAELTRDLQALQGQDLDIDASKVESVSTACVQVLLAAARSWREAKHRLAVVEPSPALLATLDRLGLDLGALRTPGAV